MMAYTASGQYVIKRAPTDHYMPPKDAPVDDADGPAPSANNQDGAGTKWNGLEWVADDAAAEQMYSSGTGPRVDRFSRATLLMIQKPENVVILDATKSFDLAVPVEAEIGK